MNRRRLDQLHGVNSVQRCRNFVRDDSSCDDLFDNTSLPRVYASSRRPPAVHDINDNITITQHRCPRLTLSRQRHRLGRGVLHHAGPALPSRRRLPRRRALWRNHDVEHRVLGQQRQRHHRGVHVRAGGARGPRTRGTLLGGAKHVGADDLEFTDEDGDLGHAGKGDGHG